VSAWPESTTGACPVDAAQFQKPDIEPVGQQAAQIVLQRNQMRIGGFARFRRIQQESAQIDQELHAVGDGGELRQQPHAGRFEGAAQRGFGGGALGGILRGGDAFIGGGDRAGIAVEFGEAAEELGAALLVERQVGLGELGGAVAGADLAAARGEAGTHLRLDAVAFLARHAGRHVAPDGGDASDRAVEQSWRGDIAHWGLPRRITLRRGNRRSQPGRARCVVR
jgi:hypothetical protein